MILCYKWIIGFKICIVDSIRFDFMTSVFLFLLHTHTIHKIINKYKPWNELNWMIYGQHFMRMENETIYIENGEKHTLNMNIYVHTYHDLEKIKIKTKWRSKLRSEVDEWANENESHCDGRSVMMVVDDSLWWIANAAIVTE